MLMIYDLSLDWKEFLVRKLSEAAQEREKTFKLLHENGKMCEEFVVKRVIIVNHMNIIDIKKKNI